jgi:hypothetical protein
MSKPPKNLPKLMSRVKLRGREPTSLLVNLNDANWAWVKWDKGFTYAKICHLYELEELA